MLKRLINWLQQLLTPKYEPSKEMLLFYRDLESWMLGGCKPHHVAFSTDDGICGNMRSWINAHYPDRPPAWSITMQMELNRSFRIHRLDTRWPFDDLGKTYYADQRDRALWNNTARRAWVIRMAAHSFYRPWF